MKDYVKILCKSCHNLLTVDDENLFGEDEECPECGADIYIPFPEPDESEIVNNKPNQKKSEKRIQCPFCKESILKNAIKCKHCKASLVLLKKKTGCLTIFVAIVFFLFVFMIVLGSLIPSVPRDKTDDILLVARGAGKILIKKILKSPSSAEFSEMKAIKLGNNRFSITGHVDSNNSFGAKLRKKIDCIIKNVRGDYWEIEHCNLK